MTKDTGDVGQFRPGNPPTEHGVTIVNVPTPAGARLRAVCLCGWASMAQPTRQRAVRLGHDHTAAAAGGAVALHHVTDQAIIEELDRRGMAWVDGTTLRLGRLEWMNEEQWTEFRDLMVAWFAGLEAGLLIGRGAF